jgi:1-acyl-sn-glycerol-3-phosphate acyltransferase
MRPSDQPSERSAESARGSRGIVRSYYIVWYYLSWLVFALVALALNFACLFVRPWAGNARLGRGARRVIRRLFDLWVRWFHFSGVVRVSFRGFDRPLAAGTIYVANHPSLIDATILLSRLPDAICIFKPKLMRNPAVGTAAIVAEYVAGNAGVDLLREVADKISGGKSLLVFPEGTRTEQGERLNPLKPGFALVAARAEAPIRLIIIRASNGLVPRGQPWWRPPPVLPAWMEVTLDRHWPYDPTRSPAELADEISRHLLERMAVPTP